MPTNLHPLVVHFPIALLITAFFFEFLCVLTRRPPMEVISKWILALGVLSVLVGVGTGLAAERAVAHGPAGHLVMETHKELALLVLGLSLFVLFWRFYRGGRLHRQTKIVFFVILATTVGVLATSAHLGGRLVFEFAAGVAHPHEEVPGLEPEGEHEHSPLQATHGTQVEIASFAYTPPELVVETGETVTWHNHDEAPHTVTSGEVTREGGNVTARPDGHIASGEFGQGKDFQFTFTQPGRYPYYCTIHPFMVGLIVVEPK